MADNEFYKIDIDRGTCMVIVTMRRFWTEAVARRFAVDYRTAIKRENWAGRYLCLLDQQDYPAQPREVAAVFAELGADAVTLARRMAIVSASILQRMQTHRISEPHVSDRANFASLEEARAWLLAP